MCRSQSCQENYFLYYVRRVWSTRDVPAALRVEYFASEVRNSALRNFRGTEEKREVPHRWETQRLLFSLDVLLSLDDVDAFTSEGK